MNASLIGTSVTPSPLGATSAPQFEAMSTATHHTPLLIGCGDIDQWTPSTHQVSV